MDGKRYTSNISNHETIEMRPQRDKPKSEPHPLSSLPHNPEFSYIDGDDNSQKTTDDTLPAPAIHHISYIPCPPGKDVGLSRNNGALVEQDLPPEPIPRTASSEELSSQDTSIHVEKSEQAIPPLAVVQPHDNVIWLVHQDKLYNLNSSNKVFLLRLPRATTFLTLNDQSGGETLTLHCSSEDDLPNVDVTSVREHFISHKNKAGYILFRSDKSFSGTIRYPLPKKNAQAKRIGYGNVFKMYHDNKTYAVKKMLRSEGAYVHSQLCHCNIINLEAILVGEKHEHRKDKHYIYCFMPEMDIDFRKLLLSNECGSLKDVKMQTVIQDWKNVMSNVKHVLRSLLKALQYMHSQGYSHSGIKLDNVLIKMLCHCEKEDLLYCTCCQQNFAVKLAGFSSAVSCDSLYSTKIDIWSFGCFLLDSFIGKYRTTEKPFEELPFYLSVEKGQCRNLEEQLNELLKYYSDTPGLCDLVQECLQVDPDWRPTAEELSQSEFLE